MTENYCIIEETTVYQTTYFKCLPNFFDREHEFFINDLIDKPKSLKSKYIKFHCFPFSENINLYIRKEILNDNNIIDLEPVVCSSSRKRIAMYLNVTSSFLKDGNEKLAILLDRHNYEILKNILTEERFSRLALEIELQGGLI